VPKFKDAKGVTLSMDEYKGASYRAIVCNIALRSEKFIWHANSAGTTKAEFECCQCHDMVPYKAVAGDHVIAQAMGGGDDLWNLQILCTSCNAADMHHRGANITDRTRGALQGYADNRIPKPK